jgi:hypothetical protein
VIVEEVRVRVVEAQARQRIVYRLRLVWWRGPR